ncbi:hypothetical protein PV783_28255 [Chitinophaga sp. CC14]|uniref:hypothetical protein n=1 Tax=Chitinophaga sp. CC14 TaxID=3029199 RepID=UPI003B7F68CB
MKIVELYEKSCKKVPKGIEAWVQAPAVKTRFSAKVPALLNTHQNRICSVIAKTPFVKYGGPFYGGGMAIPTANFINTGSHYNSTKSLVSHISAVTAVVKNIELDFQVHIASHGSSYTPSFITKALASSIGGINWGLTGQWAAGCGKTNNWDNYYQNILIIEPKPFSGGSYVPYYTDYYNAADQILSHASKKTGAYTFVAGKKKDYKTPGIFLLLEQKAAYQLPLNLFLNFNGVSNPFDILTAGEENKKAAVDQTSSKSVFQDVIAAVKLFLEGFLKHLHQQLRTLLKLDKRYLLRTVVRSLRITTFDGKEADSDLFLLKSFEKHNYYHTLNFPTKCLKKIFKYRWLNTPSLC